MPRVPIINQPSVASRPLPEFRAAQNKQSGLGDIGRSIQRAGQVIGQVVGQFSAEQEEADKARAVQEIADFTRESDSVLLDPTIDEATGKPKGYKYLQGEDAFGGRDAYTKRIEELAKAHEENLTNDTQKEFFRTHATAKVTNYLNEIQSHAGNEAERAQSQAYKIDKAVELNHVASFADNVAMRAESISKIRKVALSEASRMGLSADDQKDYADLAEADANATAMTSMLNRGKVAEAESFYAEAKDKLGVHGERIAKHLEELKASIGIEQEASNIVGSSIIKGTFWVNRSEVDAKMMDVPAGPRKEHIRKLVEHQVEKLEKSREEMADRVLNQAYSIYLSNGQNLETKELSGPKSWLLDERNSASDRWMKLVEKDFNLKNKGRTEVDRSQMRANQLAIAKYLAMEPIIQSQTDIDSTFLEADETTRYQLKKIQNSSYKLTRGGGIAKETEFQRYVDVTAKSLKYKKNDLAEFKAFMSDWRSDYLTEHDGKEPTREEMKKVVADKILEVKEREEDYKIFQSTKPKWKFEQEGKGWIEEGAKAPEPTTPGQPVQIPDSDRKVIVEKLKKWGAPVTEENINTMYKRGSRQ